ncbi:hypothetical protein [Gracilimonas sp.]|uniref:hypothetical protein n=1 Tax=Gracilimonas sp. TaxID=1974203 RepID=UPI003BA9C685
MQKTLAISFVLVFVSIVLQSLLIYLFPYTGLSRILSVPICILLSSFIAAAYYYGVKFYSIIESYSALLGFLSFLVIVILNIQFFPQESSLSVWQKIACYSTVYVNYENVEHDDIFIPRENLNYAHKPCEAQKYVAALQKYKNEIPYDGSYSLYLVRETPVSDPSDYDPVLHSSTEIYSKLNTGAEKQFFRILKWSKK